jgi:hypothetical protein
MVSRIIEDVIGILLQIQRKIKLIDNWSNKTVDLMTEGSLTDKSEGLKAANGESNSLIIFRIRSIHYALKNSILRR